MQTLKTFLPIIEVVLAVLLSAAILLQQRGTGLSATFGGDGNIYRTKRGIEKIVFNATIVFAVLLLAAAILNVVL